MQAIDRLEMAQNRDLLLGWQKQHWNRKEDGIRLHLGSGHLKLKEYINIDPYTEESDRKDDMRSLNFKPNSVSEIISHHALEHIPMRDVWKTLNHWFEILSPNGTIEIGMPDVELCCQSFLEGSEREKWGRYIWTIYGAQSEDNTLSTKKEWDTRDNFDFSSGQVHMGGFSLGHFTRMLEDIGFKMLSAFYYDGYGTPSFFVFAKKPSVAEYPTPSILEKDVVIGTFSNKTKYIGELWASANKHLPHIPFITRFNRGVINQGMSILREDFINSGKRFWCFLDDDIIFLNPDIIKNAVSTLIKGKYGAVSVYSTFDRSVLIEPYDVSKKESVIERPHQWATGYFIMVDSHKVGHILPDMNLPDGNTSVDTTYSVAIRSEGFNIGISPDYVYHERKNTISNPVIIEETNKYLFEKWGRFYFDIARYDYNVIEWK